MDNHQSKGVIEYYFKPVKEFVRMVVGGHSDALVLLSDGGLGKSYTVLQTLKEEGLKEGEDFVLITTFATPLELYNMLFNYREGKILVLDDLEGILTDRKSVSILKSALWSANNKRTIHYHSTTSKMTAPSEFQFESRVILCMNDLVDNKIVNSLISRCMFFRFNPSYQQRLEIIGAIAEKEGIAKEIVEFIKMNSGPVTKNLNFRTLIHLWNAYRYDMNNGNSGSWKILGKALLGSDGTLSLVWELSKSNKKVEEQAKEFTTKVNRSRRTFFRLRKKLA
jgi:hypothetical protein